MRDETQAERKPVGGCPECGATIYGELAGESERTDDGIVTRPVHLIYSCECAEPDEEGGNG